MTVRAPLPGRTYHYRYGYPWRWAIPSEMAWRLEHIGPRWARYDGMPLAPLARYGYRKRKTSERRGAHAARLKQQDDPTLGQQHTASHR